MWKLLFKMIFYIGVAVMIYHAPRILSFLRQFHVFLKYIYLDWKKMKSDPDSGKTFHMFGVKMFCGRQGSGKTMGMTWYLEKIRKKYPECLIYTNFGYKYETAPLQSLHDLLKFRNGNKGVVFAIDEIQNEWSSNESKNFPPELLSTITQQRKDKIMILCTSQVFSRVAKQLREQCYEVIECITFYGRWTYLRAYDREDYDTYLSTSSEKKRKKVFKKWAADFVQPDELREMYDSYAKIERLSKMELVENPLAQA